MKTGRSKVTTRGHEYTTYVPREIVEALRWDTCEWAYLFNDGPGVKMRVVACDVRVEGSCGVEVRFRHRPPGTRSRQISIPLVLARFLGILPGDVIEWTTALSGQSAIMRIDKAAVESR